MNNENKKEDPLISVIVPIYNVEKYVRKCLESLRGQTMKEIEIICIDDGSTDRSGLIADEYESSEFPIFRVIHTENRGLSAARNRGIDEATADWIMFVDSDDWVDPDFCRIPYEAAVRENADLVCFGYYRVTRFGRIKKPKKDITPTGIVNEMTVHEYGGSVTWNKLYRKSLFEEVTYPEGRVYEDIATTHKLVHEAERIMMTNECLYYHLIRNSSIGHTHNLQNSRDKFIAILDKSNDLKSYGFYDGDIQNMRQIGAIQYLARTAPRRDELYQEAKDIIVSCERIPENANLKQKIVFFASRNKILFHLTNRAIRKWQL